MPKVTFKSYKSVRAEAEKLYNSLESFGSTLPPVHSADLHAGAYRTLGNLYERLVEREKNTESELKQLRAVAVLRFFQSIESMDCAAIDRQMNQLDNLL